MFQSYNKTEVLQLVSYAILLHNAYSATVRKHPTSSGSFDKPPVQKHHNEVPEFVMKGDAYITSNEIHNCNTKMSIAHASHADFNYDLKCPRQTSNDVHDPVNKRSTCPWYYSVHHDAKQFPATTLKAERLCEYAIGSKKLLECVPVTQSTSVLKLQEYQKEKNSFVWTEETIVVVIGYTAAARRTAYSSAAQNTTSPHSDQNTPTFF